MEKENMVLDTIIHSLLVCYFLCFMFSEVLRLLCQKNTLPGVLTPGVNEFEQKSWRILTL